MLIQRFNPTDHFRTMDMLFDALMPTGRRATHFARKPARSRLTHHEDRFVLEAELPGLSADQLELEVGPDFIELSAKRELEIPEGYTAIRSERSGYSFERRISLPARVDIEAVEAKLDEGVLTVTLPKRARVQPRQIAIKAA